jgi:hypothetical protein
MPNRTLRICGAVVALALLSIPAAASAAKTKPVDVRVLTSNGKTFASFRQYTGKVHVQATEKAKCFGPDNPSSNKKYTIGGSTLLGSLADATANANDRLLLNDAFVDDGFGLGVCAIGSKVTPYVKYPDTGPYWYSAVNGVATSTGPDLIPVHAGDETLWYFASGEESGFPSELLLKAPSKATPGESVQVKVLRVAPGDGSTSPAEGVSVTDALGPTDSGGHAIVNMPPEPGTVKLTATGGTDDIPSAVEAVCLKENTADCPKGRGLRIYGSGHPDHIDGGRGGDTINAEGGDDRVDISQGGADKVKCGGGHDKVVGASSDDAVKSSCEVVKG